jgi:molybdopterin-guanine dinucleotide biosynthesis protein
MGKKKELTKEEQWQKLLELIEDIKKMNKSYNDFVVIEGKNYSFEAFIKIVLAAVKKEKENEK